MGAWPDLPPFDQERIEKQAGIPCWRAISALRVAVASMAIFLRSYLSGGQVVLVLPKADPHKVGALWNNAGVITISAG